MSQPDVKYTHAPKLTAFSLEMRGSYQRIGEAMKKVKAWIDEEGIEQAGYPFCMFYDNPGETPEPELRSEACIPVAGKFEPQGQFRMKEVGETLVAETKHEGRPEEFAKTYGPFLEGLLKQGYQIVGPAREFFLTASDVKGPGSGFLIQQPIAKKQSPSA